MGGAVSMIAHGRPMDVRGRSLRVPSACGSRVEAAQSLPVPNVGTGDSGIDLERSSAYIPVQDTHSNDSEPLRPASYFVPDSDATLAA